MFKDPVDLWQSQDGTQLRPMFMKIAYKVVSSRGSLQDFPGGPVVMTLLSIQGASAQSLVGEDPTCHVV